jgi:hypothetical protein
MPTQNQHRLSQQSMSTKTSWGLSLFTGDENVNAFDLGSNLEGVVFVYWESSGFL